MSNSNGVASTTTTPPEEPDFGASRRLAGWAVLLFCSAVSLAANVSDTRDGDNGSPTADDGFVIVVSSISIASSFLSIMGFALARSAFPGGPLEGLFAAACLVIWICGMPVIMNPNRNMAVSKGTGGGGGTTTTTEFTYIRNANIYFFSWACTISIVYICGRFAREVILRSRHLAAWTGLWYLTTLASLVVLVDSTTLYQSFHCPDNDPDLCLASKYAMSLGTVGTFISFVASVLATCGWLARWFEFIGSIVIFAMYLAGIGFITFNNGPGTSIGNLYFATWLGVGVSAVLLARVYQAIVQSFVHKPEKEESQKLPDDVGASKHEVPVLFPDAEMGGGTPKEQDDGYDDSRPSWVNDDSEVPILAPLSVPIAAPSKLSDLEEQGEVITLEPEKIATEEVVEAKAADEKPVKTKTEVQMLNSSKSKPAMKNPEEEEEIKANPFKDDKDSASMLDEQNKKKETKSNEKNKKDGLATTEKDGESETNKFIDDKESETKLDQSKEKDAPLQKGKKKKKEGIQESNSTSSKLE